MNRIRAAISAVSVLFLLATTALAQEYPVKPIVIVVPAAAGGPTDTLARVLAASMSGALKQTMLVENAGGAGGIIGINKAAKARADGYTLLLYHIGMSTAPALYRKLPYDTLNDFDYIGQVADNPMTLVAKKAMPAGNFGDFLAYIKANRERVTYAHAGIGSASFLCGLLFMSAIQTDFTQVPYKGTGPAMNDIVGGQVDFICDQTVNTLPHQGLRGHDAGAAAPAARCADARRAGIERLQPGRLEWAVRAARHTVRRAAEAHRGAAERAAGPGVPHAAWRARRRPGAPRQGDAGGASRAAQVRYRQVGTDHPEDRDLRGLRENENEHRAIANHCSARAAALRCLDLCRR